MGKASIFDINRRSPIKQVPMSSKLSTANVSIVDHLKSKRPSFQNNSITYDGMNESSRSFMMKSIVTASDYTIEAIKPNHNIQKVNRYKPEKYHERQRS